MSDTFLYTRPDHPRAEPLLTELLHEYDSRYGSFFHAEGAKAELNRYPSIAFTPPHGNFLLLLREGRAIAGGAFMRYSDDTAEFKRVWTDARSPSGPCPQRASGAGGAGAHAAAHLPRRAVRLLLALLGHAHIGNHRVIFAGDKAEQRKEKFDFSTYRQGLHGFFVKAGSTVNAIREPKDAAGLKPIELQYYDDEATRLVALRSGRADVIVQPHAQLVFITARDRDIKRVGTLSAGWPERSDVAINGLIEDDSYAKILARWQREEETLPKAETHPPGLPKY